MKRVQAVLQQLQPELTSGSANAASADGEHDDFATPLRKDTALLRDLLLRTIEQHGGNKPQTFQCEVN